jgi:hypothetical protein
MSNNGFLSKRVKLRNQSGITTDRYEFLGLDQAEPNLGDPVVGVSSVGAKPYAGSISDLYVLVSDNTGTGNRYWTNQGNVISGGVLSPGSITVRKNGAIVGSVNQITDLNFVGNGITVSNPASWVGAGSSSVDLIIEAGLSTAAGNYKSIQYAGINGILDASSAFIFDPTTQRVGINSTSPTSSLDVVGNANISGLITSRNIFTSGVSTANNLKVNNTLYASGISTIVNLNTNYLSVTGILSSNNAYISGILTSTSASVGTIDISAISIGSSFGISGQYLKTTGVGVTWGTFPTLRTGISTVATNGQTGFSISYNVGFLDVYVNGIRLNDSDYVATDGTNIILNNPCFGGESIDILAYSTVSTGSGSGSGGTTTINYYSNWASNVSGVHTTSNVGIRTTNPTSALTVEGNVKVSGIVTAASFVGDGSGLTGIIASGSGVSIKDSGSPVGTATTIDFGDNLTVSPISAGVVTVTASGGTPSQWTSTVAGIHTLSNVGIGTTNPTDALTVKGNVLVSGVLTATSFGSLNSSSLNISGVTTISQGRIQADAGVNLRFGNQAAGSGSGRNIAIGDQVLTSLSSGSGRNIGIGELSYYDTDSGQYNIGLGVQAGQKITSGSYNVIIGGYNGNSGNLDIRTSSNNVIIADGQGNIRQYINSGGNVGIKTTVVTEALTVAGVVSATSFYGTLNAGQLTGALPAIDGSALIGVVATGAGVEIRDDGSVVGTAATIDFGSNLSISFGSGIATVSGSGFATYANVSGIATYAATSGVSTASGTANYAATAGISTISGTSGYATTAGISSAVSATININTTGIITASSFSGSGSGLTNIPAGELTGTLPALDGSALLNVNATGSGIVVLDDNVNVGSARSVNFGTGLDVSYSTSGIATITASGGSLKSRTTVTGTTSSIATNGIGNINITGFKSYALMKVGLSTAGWIRLYTDSASRAADASRSQGIDPSPGSGVIAEVITTGISTTQIISPFVMGGNLDNPADTTIYAAITNLSSSTQAITANLTILQLEA